MILNLMRAYSSCHRFLPTWFILSAISEAKELLKSKKRKVVFGGKRLFAQLCIHHLQGWRFEKLLNLSGGLLGGESKPKT